MTDLRPRHGDLQAAAATVARLLVTEARPVDLLKRLTTFALEAAPPTTAAAIVVFDESGTATAGLSTDGSVCADVDAKVFAVVDGPFAVAHRDQKTISVGDIRHESHRWPEFCNVAARHGFLSTLSVPIPKESGSVGALTLFAGVAHAYVDLDTEEVADFATQTGVAISNSRAYWRAFDSGEGLRDALKSREMIGLAKGLLMSATNCSCDEAFTVLVRASQRENVKLREIAARIVESHNTTSGA